ncbi:LOW QUALITY PROTEIN: long-chain-fatty-acid--CoA ligase heimdall [Lucilia sericata]|uniref:LOW QUALITY PROTEIN: long-chain-fatty-acid--CoA ligase heimdall n=1 Tax=Lucilia sericata TaxID=13632 RepID=UPI0018A81AA1|nr:LOW QUALITY PROTEIN: long-chain-fatty-acid--CoA ligase heimdall [Lucilia sericata]
MLENTEIDSSLVPSLKPASSYHSCSLHEPVKIRTTTENLAECNIKTIPQFFKECCQKFKDVPALAYKVPKDNSTSSNGSEDEQWETITYGEYEQRVEQAALMLLHLGVQPRSSIGILAFNCPEWFYAEMGALRINAVVAGIYTSNSAEAVHHVLEASEASVCIVDDAHQMSKVRAVKSRLNQLRAVVQLNGPYDEFVGNEPGYYRWTDLFEMQFSSTLREELVLRERDVAANECALLIFTSGTVGMPKGVMISHDGVLFCCHAMGKMMTSLEEAKETVVTYLPLNHIAAQLFDIFMALEYGGLIYFADRNALKGSLTKTYSKAKVSMMFGVPRVFEKMQERLEYVEANSSALTKVLMNTARSMMESYHLAKMENKSASGIKYWLAAKVVHKIKVALGLEMAKGCFIGGAPVTEELKKFFLGLDMPLIDVYGMSETSGAVVYNFDRPNLQTSGKAMEGVELKIDNPNEQGEGEILMRGRSNFMGYLKEPEKTAETLTEDGWIKSGDLGYMDEQGNLYVSGRIKELIITAGGENIPPAHIEAVIKKELPCVSNVVVIGDHKKYLTALLTFKVDINPDTGYPLDTLRPDALQWLQSLNLNYTRLSDMLNIKLPEDLQNFDANAVEINCDPKVWQALEAGIKRYNEQAISNAQKVQYFTILPHDFSIPTGEVGPTLKIRRNIVHKKYAEIIEKMYAK